MLRARDWIDGQRAPNADTEFVRLLFPPLWQQSTFEYESRLPSRVALPQSAYWLYQPALGSWIGD